MKLILFPLQWLKRPRGLVFSSKANKATKKKLKTLLYFMCTYLIVG